LYLTSSPQSASRKEFRAGAPWRSCSGSVPIPPGCGSGSQAPAPDADNGLTAQDPPPMRLANGTGPKAISPIALGPFARSVRRSFTSGSLATGSTRRRLGRRRPVRLARGPRGPVEDQGERNQRDGPTADSECAAPRSQGRPAHRYGTWADRAGQMPIGVTGIRSMRPQRARDPEVRLSASRRRARRSPR
jgi:hypothetical protein